MRGRQFVPIGPRAATASFLTRWLALVQNDNQEAYRPHTVQLVFWAIVPHCLPILLPYTHGQAHGRGFLAVASNRIVKTLAKQEIPSWEEISSASASERCAPEGSSARSFATWITLSARSQIYSFRGLSMIKQPNFTVSKRTVYHATGTEATWQQPTSGSSSRVVQS